MKPKIILDNWRFEYLKDQRSQWNLLKVGGVIRPEVNADEATDLKNATPFGETVVDLQGYKEAPQFTEGFQLETESHTVVLGIKEDWTDAAV